MQNTHHVEPGCHLDSHFGHYNVPRVIELARSVGYNVDPFVEYALLNYDARNGDADYPHEALIEESDEAISWLNSGQDAENRLRGQNFPPIIPDGYYWAWNDGDFGLYPPEDLD